MSLSEHWVAVRTSSMKADAASEAVQRHGLDVLGEHDGWVWGRGWPTRVDTDDLVVEIAGAMGEPAIGAYVVESDFAYVVGSAGDGRVAFQLAVCEPYDPDDPQLHAQAAQWRSPELKQLAAGALASWSERFAPASVTPDRVLYALRDDEDTPEPGMGPVLAEDALREIFDEMGFPNLDRTIFLADLVAAENVQAVEAVSSVGDYDLDAEPADEEVAEPAYEPVGIDEELRELRAALRAEDIEEARITRMMIDVLEERRAQTR